MVVGSSPLAVIQTKDIAPVLSKEFIAIQATLCGFTLKCVRIIIKTYSLFRSVYSKRTSQVSWIMKGEKLSEGNCNLIKNTLQSKSRNPKNLKNNYNHWKAL